MIVYRLEHNKTWKGPYKTVPTPATENDVWASANCPGARSDFEYSTNFRGYIFGFSSIEKLRNWFDDFEGNLSDYRIAQYNVLARYVKISESKKQLIFKRSKSRLISKNEMFIK